MTAVEWLIQEYEKTLGRSITLVMSDEIKLALEKEKQQIIDAIEYGFDILNEFDLRPEQYYETLKNETK